MSKDSYDTTSTDSPIKKVSHVAVASLIVSIVAIAFLFLPLMSLGFKARMSFYLSMTAIVLGVVSFIVIVFYRKKLKGMRCTFAAMTISFLYIFVGMVPVARFMDYRGKYNLRVLDNAIKEYAKDHNGYLPVADHWCDLLLEHNKSLSRNNFKHPLSKDWPCNFAFNKNLNGLRLADVPNNVILLFEADGGWNLTGAADLLKQDDIGGALILLADGNIYSFYPSDGGIEKWNEEATQVYFEPLLWKP